MSYTFVKQIKSYKYLKIQYYLKKREVKSVLKKNYNILLSTLIVTFMRQAIYHFKDIILNLLICI